MPLKKTKEELYKPESELKKRIEEREDVFDPEKAKLSAEEKFKGKKTWTEMIADMYWQKKKAIFVGLSIVAIMVFVAVTIIGVSQYKRTSFSEERVGLEISGVQNAGGAEPVTYKISYKNDNRASLENAEILLNHSNNFILEDASVEFERKGDNNTLLKIGKIESNSQGEIEISGRFYAPKDYVVYLKPTLKFVPSNFSSPFEVSNQIGVNVATAPISMNVVASGEALDRGGVEYVVTYKNTSNIDFSDVNISLEYPEGFSFLESDERPTEGEGVWYIANLLAGAEGKIVIHGSLAGLPGDAKVVKATLGVRSQSGGFVLYNKREDVTRIVKSPLMIDIAFRGEKDKSVNLGEGVPVSIRYSNTGDKGLRDVVISMSLDSSIVNLEKLALGKGQYISEQKAIVWKASDIPHLANLAPGKEERIDFILPIKNEMSISKKEEKNFLLESVAKIESSDVLYGAVGSVQGFSPKATLKLNSKMVLESKLRFEDPNISNSGPIPPKLREETTYTVEWTVQNWFNEVDGAEVRAHLATGVKWKNVVFGTEEDISFNERTNEIVWRLGSVDNSVGISEPIRRIKFQISIIPEENQIGKTPVIIQNVDLKAKDLFTLDTVGDSINRVTTQLDGSDPNSANGAHGVVVK